MYLNTELILDKKTVSTLPQAPRDITKISLNDPTFNDADLKHLFELFPKHSNINNIDIGAHNLTQASYELILQFIQTHPQIISFYFAPILPISIRGSQYNGSINRILNEHKKKLDTSITQNGIHEKGAAVSNEKPDEPVASVTFSFNGKTIIPRVKIEILKKSSSLNP